jgi:hypothetical protein
MKYGTFNMIPKADDKFCYGNNRHPQENKTRMSKFQMKTLLITFFYIKGIGHFEFIPQGQTVNIPYNVEILKWLREAVCRKRFHQSVNSGP